TQVSDSKFCMVPVTEIPAVPEAPSVEEENPAPAPLGPKQPSSPSLPCAYSPAGEQPGGAGVLEPTPKRPHKVQSENELRLQLFRAPEFGLKAAARDALVEPYKSDYQSRASMGRKPVFGPVPLLLHMPSAAQLPVRGAPGCQLTPHNAAMLGVLSRKLHAYLDGFAPKDANGKRGDPTRVRAALRLERRGKPP